MVSIISLTDWTFQHKVEVAVAFLANQKSWAKSAANDWQRHLGNITALWWGHIWTHLSPTGEHTCFAGTSTVNRSPHRHSSRCWLEAPAGSSTEKLAAASGRRRWPICGCCLDRGPGSFDVEDATTLSWSSAAVSEWVWWGLVAPPGDYHYNTLGWGPHPLHCLLHTCCQIKRNVARMLPNNVYGWVCAKLEL